MNITVKENGGFKAAIKGLDNWAAENHKNFHHFPSSISFCVFIMAIKLIANGRYVWLLIFLMGKCCVCLNEQTIFPGATTNVAAAVIFYFLLCPHHGNKIDSQRTKFHQLDENSTKLSYTASY
ncbi:hypothetical protein CEXT_274191 [Caerostris extrusa]|uniref:Uncharacterized protein n=1 Tax=Caerostris extrusa TaxID=172846 RepID=A0AAV4N7J2_CAEEX|nr:hypothetical protein CEXT_274191 [Caerostris extrusa]